MTGSTSAGGGRFGLGRAPVALSVILAVAPGCTSPNASENAASGPGAVASASAAHALAEGHSAAAPGEAANPGPMRSRTASGTEVVLRRLEPDVGPLVAGSVRWRIETSAPLERPPTVDLVSPEMPMHGIVRYASSASDTGGWEVEVPIPMEGRWHLYVNSDDGADAAEFTLDVRPLEGGGHEHGSMEPTRHEASGPPN